MQDSLASAQVDVVKVVEKQPSLLLQPPPSHATKQHGGSRIAGAAGCLSALLPAACLALKAVSSHVSGTLQAVLTLQAHNRQQHASADLQQAKLALRACMLQTVRQTGGTGCGSSNPTWRGGHLCFAGLVQPAECTHMRTRMHTARTHVSKRVPKAGVTCRHGDAHIGFREKDDKELSRWAAKQRAAWRSGCLSPQR